MDLGTITGVLVGVVLIGIAMASGDDLEMTLTVNHGTLTLGTTAGLNFGNANELRYHWNDTWRPTTGTRT